VTAAVSETRRFAQRQAVAGNRFDRTMARVTSRTGITSTGFVVLAIAVLAWITARLVGGKPLYLGAYLLLTIFLASMAWGRRPLPLEGRRSETRARLAEGETVALDISLTARRRISTFILEEDVPELLGQPARVPVAAVDAGESIGHQYSVTLNHRGVYKLGPLRAKWGDPLGFTQRELVLQEPFEVLVHPSVEAVQDRPLTRLFEDPPIRPPVSKPWPHGLEFYGMKQYTPGDDLRRINWRAFGRTGRLLVRESEQGITDKITIVLDANRRFHTPGVISESFEAGVRAAASLGVKHLRDGYAVTLEGNAKREAGPLRGGTSQMVLLDALARFALANETLVEPIMRLVSNPSRDTHVVLITPRLDADSASRLKLLLDRGTSVLVAALLWDEDAADTLGIAASLGCQVVEIRPNAPLAVSFRREVGAGRL
jgi:uncharacterized protein (DUF58 family)